MIAAAVQKTSWTNNLGFSWFDVILVGVLAFGYWRGRKNGMTKEALLVSKWVVLVVACTFGYAPLGNLLIQTGVIKAVFGHKFNEQTAAFLTSYALIAGLVFIIFGFIKKAFKEKVSGSNAFGSSEYYLGMISGIVRYACLIIVFLAVLNAPVYSAAEIQAKKEYNNRTYGGGLQGYSGDFIPSVDELQDSVFKKSLLGPQIKNNLAVLLINTDGADKHHATAKKQPVVHIGN